MVRDAGLGRRALALDVFMCAAAALVPLGVIVWLMRLWQVDLSVPFAYGGDLLSTLAGVKGLLTTGSHLVNPALGAPGVSQLYDFPGADALNILTLRLMGLFGAEPGTAVNLLYLLGYPTAGVVTVFAMRRFHASRLVAVAVAILYALLPYHWMRGEGHLFLSVYWIVPLLTLVAVWMDSPEPPLVRAEAGGGRFPFRFGAPRSVGALVICAAAGASGVYYAFFGCFFILLVGVRAALRDRNSRVALAAVGLAAVVALVAVLQVVPSLVYSAQHGPNLALARNPGAAEVYGLKITQLFLPIDGHRIAVMAGLKATYREGLRAMGPHLDNEANTASLGLVGTLGFLVSVLAFLLGWPRVRRRPLSSSVPDDPAGLPLLGFLNVSAVLLATVGGFGGVLAAAILPQIRSYNRISVFIGFFSLLALGVLADRFLRRPKGAAWRIAGGVVVALIVLAGVLDQTPANLSGGLAGASAAYASDAAFGKLVQAELPSGAAVFQLPYMPYPEPGGPFSEMQDYDPLRAYLHTTGLRWSYGATKGRQDAAWQQATAALPVPAMIQEVRTKGFAAIWVQLNGYVDKGVAIEQELSALLGPPVAARPDGVFAVWRL